MKLFSGFPEGCPPTEALDPTLSVYRVIKSEQPLPEDFMSLSELGRTRKGVDPCTHFGISVFDTWEGADVARQNFPQLGEFIACGTLSAEHGKIKLTNPLTRHHTWWPCDGIDRVAPFKVVDES
jgi:hypothetical protein